MFCRRIIARGTLAKISYHKDYEEHKEESRFAPMLCRFVFFVLFVVNSSPRLWIVHPQSALFHGQARPFAKLRNRLLDKR